MSPRRKKPKEGTILKRKDGRFEGRYMLEGRQKSVYSRNYDDCLKRLNAAVKARDTVVNSYSLYEWAQIYLETYKKSEVGQTMFSAYKGVLKNHVIPNLKDMPLTQVKSLHIKQLLNSVESTRTAENVYNFLACIFRQAVAEQFISFNPMLGVKRIKHKRNKGKSLTNQEIIQFMQHDDGSNLFRYYLFLLYSGCRRSEALNISLKDINLDNNTLHICGTKTDGSNRYIPIFEPLKPLLADLPFNFKPGHVTRHFHDYCPNHPLHDLRHTFATRCQAAGVPLKVLQVWLGHSTIDTTADIYVDVYNDTSALEAFKVKNAFDFDTNFDTKTYQE